MSASRTANLMLIMPRAPNPVHHDSISLTCQPAVLPLQLSSETAKQDGATDITYYNTLFYLKLILFNDTYHQQNMTTTHETCQHGLLKHSLHYTIGLGILLRLIARHIPVFKAVNDFYRPATGRKWLKARVKVSDFIVTAAKYAPQHIARWAMHVYIAASDVITHTDDIIYINIKADFVWSH